MSDFGWKWIRVDNSADKPIGSMVRCRISGMGQKLHYAPVRLDLNNRTMLYTKAKYGNLNLKQCNLYVQHICKFKNVGDLKSNGI